MGFRVRTQAVSVMAMKKAIPIVIGTNRKWYTVVIPNCHRAIPSESIVAPSRKSKISWPCFRQSLHSFTPTCHHPKGSKSRVRGDACHAKAGQLAVLYATGEFPLVGASGMAR